MTNPRVGPLAGIGPAARWCLIAGIADDSGLPPSVTDMERETDLIVAEGLSAVAVHALNDLPEHRDRPYFGMFRSVALTTQMRAMAADSSAGPALGSLHAAGVPFAVVKGPAMAALHPAGWPRTYGDIDLVVTPGSFRQAIRNLESLGFAVSERAVPQWGWFDVRCREGVNFHSTKGGNLDVHHHVPPWSFGSGVMASDVLERAGEADLCGVPVKFAAPEDLLLISALHVLNDLWKGKVGLASWRDVLVVMQRIGAQRARAAFSGAGLGWLHDLMVAEIAAVVPEAGIAAPGAVERPGPAAAVRLAALGWSGQSMTTRQRLSWVARLPVINGVQFLAGSVVPSPAYIRDRHGSYRNYWRQGIADAVSTTQGADFRMTTVDDARDP